MSNSSSKELLAGILGRLDQYRYRQPLENLSAALDGKLWLIGGWVRSAFLGCVQYAGDIDCLCSLPEEEIRSRLCASSRPVSRNRNKGFRVALADHNHIDIVCADHMTSSGTIEGALEAFNFSINSAAIKIDDGSLECTQGFLEDVEARAFQLNDGYVRPPGQKNALFEDAERLVYHYGLRPNPIHSCRGSSTSHILKKGQPGADPPPAMP